MPIPLTQQFIPAFYFQEVLIDKTTGFPLAKGIVTFYEDAQRTVLKDIFELSGNAPSYTVATLPNPLTLSSVGTFQDNSGNDIIPYFFPYDSSGQASTYYVTVYSSLDGITPAVLQFARENVPHITTQGGGDITSSAVNFIPDGQFLIHNDVVNASGVIGLQPGQVADDVTNIAPNGWTFERSVAVDGVDTVNFIRLPITNIPVGNPRYACNVQCLLTGGNDAFKRIAITFNDVNKFANDLTYTLSFSAKSTGNSTAVRIKTRKNFGLNGTAEIITPITTKVITTTETMYNISFSFGSNSGYTLGTDNKDFCSILIDLPINIAFNVQFTDFMLTEGTVTVTGFPVTTNSEFSYETISGSLATPDYEGKDYYLPRVLTRAGEIYDDSYIGKIYASARNDSEIDVTELLCNGQVLDTDLYDTRTFIPYRRLYLKWSPVTPTNGLAIYGNSPTYLTGATSGTSTLTLTGNATFNLTVAEGTPATGFTITDLGGSHNVWTVVATAGSAITNGSYFTFHDNAANVYYVWMRASTTSSDPAPTGATKRIICDYTSTDTDIQIAAKLMIAINSKWVQLPDLRGEFLRGWANGSANDPDSAARTNRGDGVTGDHVGTRQASTFAAHSHHVNCHSSTGAGDTSQGEPANEIPSFAYDTIGPGALGMYSQPGATRNAIMATDMIVSAGSGTTTAPINAYVMWVVRY